MNDLAAGLVKKSSELARARGLFFSRERVTYHLIILVERERASQVSKYRDSMRAFLIGLIG